MSDRYATAKSRADSTFASAGLAISPDKQEQPAQAAADTIFATAGYGGRAKPKAAHVSGNRGVSIPSEPRHVASIHQDAEGRARHERRMESAGFAPRRLEPRAAAEAKSEPPATVDDVALTFERFVEDARAAAATRQESSALLDPERGRKSPAAAAPEKLALAEPKLSKQKYVCITAVPSALARLSEKIGLPIAQQQAGRTWWASSLQNDGREVRAFLPPADFAHHLDELVGELGDTGARLSVGPITKRNFEVHGRSGRRDAPQMSYALARALQKEIRP